MMRSAISLYFAILIALFSSPLALAASLDYWDIDNPYNLDYEYSNVDVGNGSSERYREYNFELERIYKNLDESKFEICAIDWGCNFAASQGKLTDPIDQTAADKKAKKDSQLNKAKIAINADHASLSNGQGYTSQYVETRVKPTLLAANPQLKSLMDEADQIKAEADSYQAIHDDLQSDLSQVSSLPQPSVSSESLQDLKDAVDSLPAPTGMVSNFSMAYAKAGEGDNVAILRDKASFLGNQGYRQLADVLEEVAENLETYKGGSPLPAINLSPTAQNLFGINPAGIDPSSFFGHELFKLANKLASLPSVNDFIRFQLSMLMQKLRAYAGEGLISSYLSQLEYAWSAYFTLVADPMAKLGVLNGLVVGVKDTASGIWTIASDPVGAFMGLVNAVRNYEQTWQVMKSTALDSYELYKNCHGQAFECGELVGKFSTDILLGVMSSGAWNAIKGTALAQKIVTTVGKVGARIYEPVIRKAIKLKLGPDDIDDILDYGPWNCPVGAPCDPSAINVADVLLQHADDAGVTGADALNVVRELFDSASKFENDLGTFYESPTEVLGRRIYKHKTAVTPGAPDSVHPSVNANIRERIANGETNLDLMRNGNAPIGPDGKQVEVHHLLQAEPGPMAEIVSTIHSDYHKILHGLRAESFRKNPALRNEYAKFRRNYWKKRAEDF